MKSAIRKEFLEKRNSLIEFDVDERTEKIIENLMKLKKYKNAKTVMIYVSAKNEVNTQSLINSALKNKTVYVPYMDGINIAATKITNLENLKPARYGILEPINKKSVNKNKIEVIIVPGIVFDEAKNRIGYGKGYFDRFLEDYSGVKIALCYDFQLIEKVPIEEFDVKMDFIVTESRVIS